MAKKKSVTFRCEGKLADALEQIAVERGRELSLPPNKLMSSIVRQAVEQFVERYRAAKRQAKQAAESTPQS